MVYFGIFLLLVAIAGGIVWFIKWRQHLSEKRAINKAKEQIQAEDGLVSAIETLAATIPWLARKVAGTGNKSRAREVLLQVEADRTVERVAGYSALGSAILGALLVLWAAVVVVQPGTVGVMVVFGDAHSKPLGEGISLVNPFAKVYLMDVRTQSYTMTSAHNEGKVKGDDSVGTLSRDGLPMQADVTITYRLIGTDAVAVYRYFGVKYEEDLIRPASRTALNEAMSEFLAIDAYAKRREQLGVRIAVLLRQHLDDILRNRNCKLQGFQIVRVMVRQIQLPERMKTAIQNKLASEQEAQRMEFVLAKERKERERKEIEAEGIKKFQDIVRQGIDEQLLRWKGIEATMTLASSPNTKIVVIGGKDGLPLILNSSK